VSDCCLMPCEQFLCHIVARTSYILTRWWWYPLCTRSTCLVLLLVLPHWNNSARVNMSLHSDILSWFLPGMIPLYDLESLGSPKIIGSK